MTDSAYSHTVLHAQAAFRAILDVVSHPGTVRAIVGHTDAPAPLSPGAAAVARTLCDHDTPVWLDSRLHDNGLVGEWLRFHCGCPLASEPREAAFAFASEPAALPAFDVFDPGTADYPDRSTTLVLQVDTFDDGQPLSLMGPGIRGNLSFRAKPLPGDFGDRLVRNRLLFPRGIDLILVTANAVAALPRSVRVVED
jgi:alpha-D-ribose 1-methylphosphonate 5-triphosphate synthase subunit PhnH